MRILPLIILLCGMTPTLAYASHSFGGLDMCALYPEVMPPGMPLDQLPDANSSGANLLQTYCNQCHELPGPGRHTAEEWPSVFKHMVSLMEVNNKFGGLLGNIKSPDADEQAQLLNYLRNNSLKPLSSKPIGLGTTAFEHYCNDCHALPDPTQHTASEWSDVLKRMQRNMQVMQYSPPSADNLMQIHLFLQTGQYTQDIASTNSQDPEIGVLNSTRKHYVESSMALGPFLLLAIIGLLRWYVSYKQHRQAEVV